MVTVLTVMRLPTGFVDEATGGLAVVGRSTLPWGIFWGIWGVYRDLRSLVASFLVF